MGRLITRVREAEERLAAIARTLQTAYEEELAEARAARESATRGLRHAEAMEQAAVALGRDELAMRLREVCEQFRASERAARQRAEELAAIEATITMRLSAPAPDAGRPALPSHEADSSMASNASSETHGRHEAQFTPPSVPQSEASAAPSTSHSQVVDATDTTTDGPAHDTMNDSMHEMGDDTDDTTVAAPEPSELVRELLGRVAQLAPRVDQVARVAPRAPPRELQLAVQEHVALARLLQERLDAAGWDGRTAVDRSLEKLSTIASANGIGDVVGLNDDEFADWNRVAAEARAERTVLAEARKRRA